MVQKLIVEGKDAISIASLCESRAVNLPKGYETKSKFINEFVKNAQGYDNAKKAFREILANSNTELQNLGIIVDADRVGYKRRWQEIRHILSENAYSPAILQQADAQTGPKIIKEAEMPTIGVWIMPDNASTGYLEHFLAQLIPTGDELWRLAETTVDSLTTKSFNELNSKDYGKAKLYTWLAWKKEPGYPFGTAITKRYLNSEAPAVQPFLDWFSATFQLST